MFKCNECGWNSSHSDRCLNCGNTKNEESVTLFSFEKLFLEKLKDLCLEYDYVYGIYPESTYEGKSLYDFYRETSDVENENWIKEAYEKFAEDKGEL